MYRHLVLAASVLPMLMTAPLHARDRTGYQAIVTGDLVAAERRLMAERRVFPNRPELMLNLAAVYARTGRTAEANALYAQVLARPASMLDMSSGRVASSHAVATKALAALDANVTIASR